jgi:predicted nucleic acid-binding protein
MRLVVADTSPVSYLLSIGHIDLLPRLFGKVVIPDAVQKELKHPTAPQMLREWSAALPVWLDVKAVQATIEDAKLKSLGPGEREAITLALSLRADLILIDECKGTAVALQKGLDVTSTLGILRLAAQRGFINLADAFDRLKQTNFRYRQEILDAMLNEVIGGAV